MTPAGRKSLNKGGGTTPRLSCVWDDESEASLRLFWEECCPEARNKSEALRRGAKELRRLAERARKRRQS